MGGIVCGHCWEKCLVAVTVVPAVAVAAVANVRIITGPRVRHPHTPHTVRRPKPTPRPYENPNQVPTSPVENACTTSMSCK